MTPVTVPLKPKSHVFESDHRIRVAVSAAYFPRTLPLRDAGSFDVVSTPTEPSVVTFPGRVHEDGVTFENTVAMADPDATVSVTSDSITSSTSRWRTDRDHTADAATLTVESDSTVLLPTGAQFRRETTVDARAETADPGSASLRTEAVAELLYDGETIRSESVARTSRDVATISTTVTVDSDPIFEQTWRRSNPVE